MMEPVFPTFDRFSMPLLIMLAQGLVFVVLIGFRFVQKRNLSDLFLGLLLLLFCFERIHYTIGFMSWYDSFPNTKINYFLVPMTLAFGPLLFLYVKSITTGLFKWRKLYAYHFLPWMVYLLYRAFLFFYDLNLLGFNETQNGYLMSNLEVAIINPLFILFASFHLLLYLAFTIQLYILYRVKIKQFYSNVYTLELNWIRNFLILFTILFLYDVFQNFVDGFIMSLHWTQKWWYHLLSSAAILYFGIKGYFTETSKLQDLDFNGSSVIGDEPARNSTIDYSEEKENVKSYMRTEKPYLDPTLTLSDLSQKLGYTNTRMSEIINSGFSVNFNDFINNYRVKEVKEALDKSKYEQLSLVGIAFDCGFNSKATFNRVFKKLTGMSPSEYIDNQVK